MNASARPSPLPLLISFSGIDGAGKSTHIQHLCESLRAEGGQVAQLAFWDDVVVWTRFRESVTHKVFKSEAGVGAPGKPVRRRDKNVSAWYLSLARSALYMLDALHLRRIVRRARRTGAAVIIFDRYIYDEVANLRRSNPLVRAWLGCLIAIAPRPDLAYLIDADPEDACARKPEYPLEFSRRCRQSYVELAKTTGMVIVSPGTVEQMGHEIWERFQQVAAKKAFHQNDATRGDAAGVHLAA